MRSKTSKRQNTRSVPLFSRTFAESEISDVARELVELLRTRMAESNPVVVALNGPMGAGKSTLIRACLEVLKADGDYKGSPTYALAHEYETSIGRVAHMDWYRIESTEELESMGMRDYLSKSYMLLFIEWADRYPEWIVREKNVLTIVLELENKSQGTPTTISKRICSVLG